MSVVYNLLFGQEDEGKVGKRLQDIQNGQRIMALADKQAKGGSSLRFPMPTNRKLQNILKPLGIRVDGWPKRNNGCTPPSPKSNTLSPKTHPAAREITSQIRNVCDITHLAFQTDSTRVITFGYFEQNKVNVPGVQNAYHALSHHGKDPNNINQLKKIESVFFKELARLLDKLQSTTEGSNTLLDNTTILVTSNLGNGSSHSTKDLPALLIGGNYNHSQHFAFEPSTVPMCNLFVSILNQFGMADKSFGSSTGALAGLEVG